MPLWECKFYTYHNKYLKKKKKSTAQVYFGVATRSKWLPRGLCYPEQFKNTTNFFGWLLIPTKLCITSQKSESMRLNFFFNKTEKRTPTNSEVPPTPTIDSTKIPNVKFFLWKACYPDRKQMGFYWPSSKENNPTSETQGAGNMLVLFLIL